MMQSILNILPYMILRLLQVILSYPPFVFRLVAALWPWHTFAPIKDFLVIQASASAFQWCYEVSPSDLLPLTYSTRYSKSYHVHSGQTMRGEEKGGLCRGSRAITPLCERPPGAGWAFIRLFSLAYTQTALLAQHFTLLGPRKTICKEVFLSNCV